VNGVQIRGDQPLENGDVISVGQGDYRIAIKRP